MSQPGSSRISFAPTDSPAGAPQPTSTIAEAQKKQRRNSAGVGFNNRNSHAHHRSSSVVSGHLTEARAALGLGAKHLALTAELTHSPFGHHLVSASAEDELEALARLFTTHNFTTGQELPAAAAYLVVSGVVSVHGREWRVNKGPGEWVLNPHAVPPRDLDEKNYAYAAAAHLHLSFLHAVIQPH